MTRYINSSNNCKIQIIYFSNTFQVFLKRYSYIPHSKNNIFFHYAHEQQLGLHPFLFHIQDLLALSCTIFLLYLYHIVFLLVFIRFSKIIAFTKNEVFNKCNLFLLKTSTALRSVQMWQIILEVLYVNSILRVIWIFGHLKPKFAR